MFSLLREGPTAVYPRWRGEHCTCNMVNDYLIGLSPLARGTRGPGLDDQRPDRFIPAGAGNTPPERDNTAIHPVYPRWRGEHFVYLHMPALINGLSPLARGTPKSHHVLCRLLRFIPAGAGNTRRNNEQSMTLAVYPRWRGEHSCSCRDTSWAPGLSPLARGTQVADWRGYRANRFIPAGAGNTLNVYHCL